MAQRILEPTLYSKKLENGTVFYDLLDCDIGGMDAERVRKIYDSYKKFADVALESEGDELNVEISNELQEANTDKIEFQSKLASELSVFD